MQNVAVQLQTAKSTQLIAQGLTGNIMHATQGVTVAASLFDDPFFFDLNAFNRFKISHNPDEFCGQNGVNPTNDFFKGLNTMAVGRGDAQLALAKKAGRYLDDRRLGEHARCLGEAGRPGWGDPRSTPH